MSRLAPFELSLRGRIVFGPGALDRLGEVVTRLHRAQALLITDAGVMAAGIAPRAVATLREAGVPVSVHAEVREDPTDSDVRRALEAAQAAQPDLLIAVGGGSAIDTAKGVNLATGRFLPIVAVPTTAGTGSEVQSYALIADDETHRKRARGNPANVPSAVILDPELTLSLPERVTAAAGVDALVHALETAVTRARTAASLLFAHEAFRLIVHHLERVLADPRDLEARAAMLLGATWAGQAIELSMLGAAHAAANPLSARYGTVHGHAVALMAPHVIRYNSADAETRAAYDALRRAAGIDGDLADYIAGMLTRCKLPTSLRAAGITSPDVDALAADAATQWTGQHNPRPVDHAAFVQLYRAASEAP